MPTDTRSKPKGTLGFWMCTALVVGNMIGSGIFLLPSSLAVFGPISMAGWVLTAGGAIVLALIFGRLARLSSNTGGPYAYAREGFGDFAGFLIAWGYWIALWSGNAAVAVAFAGYLSFMVPAIGETALAGLAVSLGAIWLLTWVNLRGVRQAGIVQVVTTVMKLAPLLVLILLGLSHVQPANFRPANVNFCCTFCLGRRRTRPNSGTAHAILVPLAQIVALKCLVFLDYKVTGLLIVNL